MNDQDPPFPVGVYIPEMLTPLFRLKATPGSRILCFMLVCFTGKTHRHHITYLTGNANEQNAWDHCFIVFVLTLILLTSALSSWKCLHPLKESELPLGQDFSYSSSFQLQRKGICGIQQRRTLFLTFCG